MLVWSHTRVKGRIVERYGLLVITLVFILLAEIPASVGARETCLLPVGRQVSDIEISELFLGYGGGQSCEDKRGTCWRVFGGCLDNFAGNSRIDKEFWEVERRRVCDTRVMELCLEGLEESDSKRDIAALSPRTDENAIQAPPASFSQLPTQSSRHYPIITATPLPRRNKVQIDSSTYPFTWLISTTTITTVLAAPSGSDPIPTAVAITLFDENGDSVIDSEDLKIMLQREQSDDDNGDDGTKGKNKPEQTVADVRKEFETYCTTISNGGGPESCSWTGLQFVQYYTGNWTEFCSKSARKAMKKVGVNPPTKKCKKCNPDKDIDERDSVCLRLVFFTWPIEFGGVETSLPTPTRGLSFPQRTLVNSGFALGDSLRVGRAAFVVVVCALAGGFLGVF